MKKNFLGMLVVSWILLLGFFFVQAPRVQAAEHADVISKIYFTDKDGNQLTPPSIKQWHQFRINVDFYLRNNVVKAGDTTVLQLPDVLAFPSNVAFDLLDKDGHLVAKTTIDRQSKQITITYEPYVESHSDVTGKLYFYVRMDHLVVTEEKDVPIDITVHGKVIPAGTIHFEGISHPWYSDLSKVGWQDSKDPKVGHYYIALNRSGRSMEGVRVVDLMLSPGVTYRPESFRVYKGNWDFRDGDWILDNPVDVTKHVTVSHTGTGFEAQLPNLSPTEGILIFYIVDISYLPTSGERFVNQASLTTTNGISRTDESVYTFYRGGGEAQGYVFTIKIKKTDEAGNALQGAKFDVIRDRTGLVVGQLETDSQGEAEVGNLLKDTYTIRETAAPAGFFASGEIKVRPEDFDSTLLLASKTIVNKKITPAKASLAVSKSLTGRNLQADQFEFVLTDEKGTEVERVTNRADGQVRFSEIQYDSPGVYKYTITEGLGGTTVNQVTYDGLVVTATVTVRDNQQGQLVASVSYSGDTEFNNIYQEPTTTTTTTRETSTTSATTTTSESSTTTSQSTTSSEPSTTTTLETTTTATTTTEPTTSSMTTTGSESTTQASTTTSEAPTTSETTTSAEPTTTRDTTTAEPTTTTTTEPTTTMGATTSEAPPRTTNPTPPPTNKKGKVLPKTGEASGPLASMIGLVLLAGVGCAVLLSGESKVLKE